MRKIPPIGVNVRRLRESKGWTQEYLAEKAKLSSVRMIETGRSQSPRAYTQRALAKALGVSVADLHSEPVQQSRSKVGTAGRGGKGK